MLFVVFGVSGSGKSTVGEALARRLGAEFADGDDFHSEANRSKMAAGHPLTDEDRGPWLAAVSEWLLQRQEQGKTAVVACSALRRSYRELLGTRKNVLFVYLRLDPATVTARLASRQGHFFGPELAATQFAALEEPGADEPVLTVDATLPVDQLVDQISSSQR